MAEEETDKVTADGDAAANASETDDGDEKPKKKKRLAGKKLVLFIALPILLLGGGGVYFSGLLDTKTATSGGEAADHADKKPADIGDVVFYDLPEMLVNLYSTGRKTHYLKIRVSLELADESDVDRLEQILPRVIDNFQVYLRELRIEDLQGSAGLFRLREELLLRVSAAAAPVQINDVLFKEMLIQ